MTPTQTALSTLISRMNVYTPIFVLDEVRKVNAIDQAIRMFRMKNQPPWVLKHSTLRIFQDVLTYPVASDHAQLAFLDDQLVKNEPFGDHPRYVYTSIKDFSEDPTPRNTIAEIWQSGAKFLGVRNNTATGLTSQLVDDASVAANWAGSDDAGTPVLDEVLFITGSSSIRVPVTNSTNVATITDTFANSINETNYKAKYYFEWVYLDSIPTSIDIRLRTDASNYLSTNVTTQFAGQPFVADDWNLIAMDLNTATVTGTVTGTFASAVYILNGAATGNYYFDASYLRGWVLQDYWYYSTYNVVNSALTSFAEYFAPDGATYDATNLLIGDTAWHDAIMYEACMYLLSDQKEANIYVQVETLRNMAWGQFFGRYPDMSPHIITNVYRFQTDYQADMTWPDWGVLG